MHQPTPELPVEDVSLAQAYYRDRLGFDIAWHNEEGRIGAVAHDDCAIFFRETNGQITPVTLWFYCPDLNGTHARLAKLGAEVIDPPERKPWGLHQFTIRDLNGHILHFHHDGEAG